MKDKIIDELSQEISNEIDLIIEKRMKEFSKASTALQKKIDAKINELEESSDEITKLRKLNKELVEEVEELKKQVKTMSDVMTKNQPIINDISRATNNVKFIKKYM